MISTSDLCQLLTLVASVGLSSAVVGGTDNCMFQDSTVHIDKDLLITRNGETFRSNCLGTVSMKKCEGTCDSAVTPSVQSPDGFRKNCRCCRETATRDRTVSLSCYQGSQVINDFHQEITVKEVTGCHCQECHD
uniref:Bursicon beta n=1 Tax=Deroceras reticulatum TaxID=145610 RepID=A0A1X9ZNE0_DERRE|nr:bursicon beta [Deroceras reticulatum]